MRAGCDIPLEHQSSNNLEGVHNPMALASHECMTAIASNLSERRRMLLNLAQRELGILQHYNHSHVADGEAAALCKTLRAANVSIPAPLKVPSDYATIYHDRNIAIHHFPTFFESGFRDYKLYNSMGLTPIMVWRSKALGGINGPKQLLEALPWLSERGFLEGKPEDPWGLGLNENATGWHYIASFIGSGCFKGEFDNPLNLTSNVQQGTKIIEVLSQIPDRDNCACLCNPDGKGCSPLKSLWKAHAGGGILDRWPWSAKRTSLRHLLFHHRINEPGGEGDVQATLALELVRYLTFEALEMTHSCCTQEHVWVAKERFYTPLPSHHRLWDENYGFRLITNADPESVRAVMHDEREQRDAHQLDDLMEEFAGKIKKLGSSPKALEGFIWGYWRKRISELFVVNHGVVDDMERVLENVRTRKFPETRDIRALLTELRFRYSARRTPKGFRGNRL